ncbi:MAG: sensor histidine kinase, partial [Gaiellaceae bacterium]
LPVSGPRDEVSRLGETLNAMLERLESALEHERRFVADASHELRTPLALLKTELELAQRSARTREELEAAIRSAADETDRLTQLSEDLLLLARSDDDLLALREGNLSSAELFERIAERFRIRADRQDREIATASDADVRLRGDQLRLEQALGNLIDNALRHGEGTITLRAAEHGDHVELHVTDEGDGFPLDFVDQAFERFSQADEARSDTGSGLGLAIVDVIARSHGGSAHVSTTGAADVWLVLPSATG